MNGVRSEPRTAMMAVVELSWEEVDGTTHGTIRATMEDTSRSGARIRTNSAIGIGSTVWVKRPWEEIAGVTKYCRREGREYILGIQKILDWRGRKTARNTAGAQEKPEHNAARVANQNAPVTTQKAHAATGAAEPISGATKMPQTKAEAAANTLSVAKAPKPNTLETVVPLPKVNPPAKPVSVQTNPVKSHDKPRIPLRASGPPEQAQSPLLDTERRRMSTSWLGMTFRRQKEEPSNGKDVSIAADSKSTVENAASEQSGENGAGNKTDLMRGDLQSPEDIYRAAGILNPRMGYSIHKVVEMIHSDHMRGLPAEAKRAAILMALDAASVSVEEILRDATQRREALQVYEAAQSKSFEEYWARKAESSAQIQAETDRLVAQNRERIQRNQNEVSREKADFAKWQAIKHREAERIAEAVELCSKPSAAEAETDASLSLKEIVSSHKPS